MKTIGIQVTHYTRGERTYRVEEIDAPSWEVVERELRTMKPYEKPLLWLLTSPENTETSCMAVCGGDDLYHASVADAHGVWTEAVNPGAGEDEVAVWTSDQGFITKRRFTWSTEAVIPIVKAFFEQAAKAQGVVWQ